MSSLNFLSFTLISSLLVIGLPLNIWVESKGCSINAIYSFGDSIADTGNLLQEGPVGFFASIGSYPYGESYKKPTGRCSDGLLIIDYLGTYFASHVVLYCIISVEFYVLIDIGGGKQFLLSFPIYT